MPLTPFQAAVAQELSAQRTPDSYLAGGAALNIEPNSIRYSNDLDYFNDSTERVASAFATDRKTLQDAGYLVEVAIERNGFVRALVKRLERRLRASRQGALHLLRRLGLCWRAGCRRVPRLLRQWFPPPPFPHLSGALSRCAPTLCA